MSEHQWFQFRNLTCCRQCGIVQRADGKNKPCKGPMKLRPMEPIWPLEAEGPDETEEQGRSAAEHAPPLIPSPGGVE